MVVPNQRWVEQGGYEVDVERVADAIVARMLARACVLPVSLEEAQMACSNPVSSASASTKTAAA